VVAVLALGIAVGFKYAIIGKRTPGRYNWDESSYCQRWQVSLILVLVLVSVGKDLPDTNTEQ